MRRHQQVNDKTDKETDQEHNNLTDPIRTEMNDKQQQEKNSWQQLGEPNKQPDSLDG